jgi:hypothetical protein
MRRLLIAFLLFLPMALFANTAPQLVCKITNNTSHKLYVYIRASSMHWTKPFIPYMHNAMIEPGATWTDEELKRGSNFGEEYFSIGVMTADGNGVNINTPAALLDANYNGKTPSDTLAFEQGLHATVLAPQHDPGMFDKNRYLIHMNVAPA